MPETLLIIGAGGLAKETGQLARRIDPDGKIWRTISYVAATAKEKGATLPFGSVDYSDDDLLGSDLAADAVIAVGNPLLRCALAEKYEGRKSLSFPNLVHPSVHVDPDLVTLGKGNLIAQGVIMTCNIVARDFNLFNKGSMIGHDVTVGSCNVVNPQASVSGGARLGDCCLIGIGARVLEKIQVADRTVLGAGAVLFRDVSEPGHTFFGVPARKLR